MALPPFFRGVSGGRTNGKQGKCSHTCPAYQNVRSPEVSTFEKIKAVLFRSCVMLFDVVK